MPQIIKVHTSDSKVYQIQLQLLKKYSNFFDVMIDSQQGQQSDSSQQMQPIILDYVSEQAFDYIYEFLQLHKTNPPKKISKPVMKNIPLNSVMNEQDAELMQRIINLPTQTKVEILNGASYLQIQTFKTLLTYALIQKQLQQPLPQITTNVTLQQEIKLQIEKRINSLIEMENHIKRLQQQDFKQQQQREQQQY